MSRCASVRPVSPMSVAFFASAFYPHIGGVEELVRQLAAEYRARGNDCIVVTNRWPRDLPEHETVEEIPVYRLPLRAPEGSRTAPLVYAVAHDATRRRIARILRRHAVTIVHVQCVSANGHYAALASRDLRLPLIVTAQGERLMDANAVYERSAFLNRTLRSLLVTADGITACSADVLADLETFGGRSLGRRGQVIHNGVSIEEFTDEGVSPRSHQRPYVLALGRCVAQKGFDVLLRAFADAVVRDGFDHDLLIAGDGPELPHLRQLAESHRLAGRAQFLGAADRNTVVSLYKGCSFFVVPSRYEPFGIVHLEAMACGKAIVATRVGGIPEIVADGVTGLLVEPGDPGQLCDALVNLARSAQVRAALGARGRDAVARFAWPRIADEYLSFYGALNPAEAPAGLMSSAPRRADGFG
jgi:glycogen(starch) synthase